MEQTTAAVIDFLRRPTTYGEPTRTVDVVETHISYVFLTATRAYKLKKPVRYDFLDFSTLEARHHACQEELRLNRRLAGDVYLDVVPVVADENGNCHLGGRGDVVDWVVTMRRLDTEQSLARSIEDNRVSEEQIERLASRLSQFYTHAEPLDVRADEYRAKIEDHVRANRRELLERGHHLSPELVKRVHVAQLSYLLVSSDELDRRVRQGRIIDGHGDLRPEHVVFDAEPVVFDCIEFSEEFRRVDVADELSFLAMECELLGADWIGKRVIDAYCAASGDRPTEALLALYKSYRACVRAKVAALRADQLSGAEQNAALSEATDYLQLADRHAKRLGPPVMIVVRGLMGSGKTTLATALADSLGAEHLETDAIRRELFPPSGEQADYSQGRYSAENRSAVYDAMIHRAAELLDIGLSVVLDGTFISAAPRSDVARLAGRRGARNVFAACRCPAEISRERITRRTDRGETLSEARVELYEEQARQEEADPPGLSAVEVDTTADLAAQVDAVLEHLRSQRILSPQPAD